ncbi:hypothetical protein B566_EDAN008311 [Ephemera danica]|nr:hypothetical protein B566_EDAN008311 [Ephemera danica]
MLGRWVFPMPTVTCPLVMYLQHVSVFVSVYTLTAIGIDRAILYPLNRRASRCRSRLVLAVIWVAACVICSCIFVVTKAKKVPYEKVYHWDCGEQWGSDENHGAQLYTLAVLVVTFGVPMLFLAFTYSAVALHLWKRATPGNADPARDQMQLQATKKVLLMLVTIVLLFAACWLPLQLFLVLYYFVPGFDQSGTENRPYYAGIYLACHWLACANSCVNPIVYCFMSDNFLMDLKEILRNCGRSKNLRQRNQGGSSTSTRTTTASLQHGKCKMK